jgi:hypothetical protein
LGWLYDLLRIPKSRILKSLSLSLRQYPHPHEVSKESLFLVSLELSSGSFLPFFCEIFLKFLLFRRSKCHRFLLPTPTHTFISFSHRQTDTALHSYTFYIESELAWIVKQDMYLHDPNLVLIKRFYFLFFNVNKDTTTRKKR